jgi:hypothetical protein
MEIFSPMSPRNIEIIYVRKMCKYFQGQLYDILASLRLGGRQKYLFRLPEGQPAAALAAFAKKLV